MNDPVERSARAREIMKAARQAVAGDPTPLAALGLQMTPEIETVRRNLFPNG